jgi:hypothetical protein
MCELCRDFRLRKLALERGLRGKQRADFRNQCDERCRIFVMKLAPHRVLDRDIPLVAVEDWQIDPRSDRGNCGCITAADATEHEGGKLLEDIAPDLLLLGCLDEPESDPVRRLRQLSLDRRSVHGRKVNFLCQAELPRARARERRRDRDVGSSADGRDRGSNGGALGGGHACRPERQPGLAHGQRCLYFFICPFTIADIGSY